jgi:hypothetical protein
MKILYGVTILEKVRKTRFMSVAVSHSYRYTQIHILPPPPQPLPEKWNPPPPPPLPVFVLVVDHVASTREETGYVSIFHTTFSSGQWLQSPPPLARPSTAVRPFAAVRPSAAANLCDFYTQKITF